MKWKVDLYVGAMIIKNNINETVKLYKYILRLIENLNKYKQYMNIGGKITAAPLGYIMKYTAEIKPILIKNTKFLLFKFSFNSKTQLKIKNRNGNEKIKE